MKRRTLHPKPILDSDALSEAFERNDINLKHVKTAWRLIIQQGFSVDDLESYPNFPKRAVQVLREEFSVCTSKVVSRTDASDGSTTKLLIELQDGRRIETVIMRYGHTEFRSYPEEERVKKQAQLELESNQSTFSGAATASLSDRRFKSNFRATVCVSSQVGCNMGCTFCATGTMGLLANLNSGEILEQLYHASRVEKIRNVVFMGMGEPLDNYKHLLLAVQGMTDICGFSLSASKITVSTVGVVPRMLQMIQDMPRVRLALSLHAPTQELRLKIVPTAKAYPIHRVMEAADAFVAHQNQLIMDGAVRPLRGRKGKTPVGRPPTPPPQVPETSGGKEKNRHACVLLEYVLLGPDVNCSLEVAHDLGRLLSETEERLNSSMLNVIPYNPTSAGEPHGFKPPSQTVINAFVAVVREYGVTVTVRQELGQDVNAACGQLVVDRMEADKSKCASDAVDIEDVGLVAGSDKKRTDKQGALRQRRKPASTVDKKAIPDLLPVSTGKERMWRLLALGCFLMLVRLVWKFYQVMMAPSPNKG